MKLKNKFVAVVPVYNMSDHIVACIQSIIDQDYPDIGIIIRDDLSTDNTAEVISNYIGIDGDETTHTKFKDRDIIFIKNKEKLNATGNVYESAMEYVEDDSVYGVVDGDDYLCKSYSVSRVMEEYEKNDNTWLVWSQHKLTSASNDPQANVAGMSRELPPDSVLYQSRQYWSVSHFRTNKKFLFNHLKEDALQDLEDPSLYYEVCGDAAYIFPFTEMCGNDRAVFIPEVLYCYRDDLPTNDHRQKYQKAVNYGTHIRALTPYNKL